MISLIEKILTWADGMTTFCSQWRNLLKADVTIDSQSQWE